MRASSRRFGSGLLCVIAAGAALLAAVPGCRILSTGRPNVVLITLDTTRADRLGCYGYAAAQTPVIDALAENGALFENVRAHAPVTAPSHASILTGTLPTFHGVVGNLQALPPSGVTTLAECFADAGYTTAASVGAFVVASEWGLDRGFDAYFDELPEDPAGSASLPQRLAGEVVADAIEWLDGAADAPFFLWVHLFDPHAPYEAPDPFRLKLRDPYDAEIAYADHAIGRLLAHLTEIGERDETLVVVTADHGEALGEHDEDTHGFFLYNETLSVPLIFDGPGIESDGRRVEEMVRTIDVMPTILELSGLPAAPGVQGRSLVSAISTGAPPSPEPAFALSNELNLAFGWSPLRSLEHEHWKLIRAPRPELYDLDQDPGELTNLASTQPDVAARLDSTMSALIQATTGNLPTGTGGTVDQATLERLRSLGYVAGGERGQQVPLDEDVSGFTDPKDREAYWEGYKRLSYLRGDDTLAEAEALARELLAEDPDPPLVHYLFGQVLWHKAQRSPSPETLREAREHLRIAAIMDEYRISSLVFVGIIHAQLGELDQAREVFDEILRIDPDEAMSHFNLTLIHARRQNWSRVVHHGEAVLRLIPDHPDAPAIRRAVEGARKRLEQ